MNKKEKKYLDPESNNNSTIKLINKSFSIVDENKTTKNHEPFNVVSETGDSIYSSSPIEDLDGGGQIFYSVSAIRDIVRQELVAAGIQVKSEE